MIAGTGTNAWWVLIIGILTIAVSLGLFRGNNTARIIMAVVFTLNLVVAVWAARDRLQRLERDRRRRARDHRTRLPVLEAGERVLHPVTALHRIGAPTPSEGRGFVVSAPPETELVVRSQRFHKNGHRKAGR